MPKQRKPVKSIPRPGAALVPRPAAGDDARTMVAERPSASPMGEVTAGAVIWGGLRPVLVFLAALVLTMGVLYTVWRFVSAHFIDPPDAGNTTLSEFVIPSGSSVRSVASKLFGDPEDPGRLQFITSKTVFQYAFEFLGQGHQIKAGSYMLSPSMTITDIIDVITRGNPAPQTMRVRLIEGMTAEEMADELVAQKALTGTKEFLDICKSGEVFRGEFDFIDAVLDDPNLSRRRYALEGYLFPDTYEIYVDSSAESIIRRMLRRTDEVFSVNAYDLAQTQNVTMDWVLNLASIIEKESKTDDFAKVSAVFHNRIGRKMPLQSDVTIQYILRTKRMALNATDIAVDSPYNSYTREGMPPSPVANPGLEAILAALMPDEGYMTDGYLYFTSTDPESGVLAFSKTLKEHDALAAEYRPMWEAYDAKMAATPTPTPAPTPTPGAATP